MALGLAVVLPGGGQAIAVTTFSISPVAITVLTGSTAPASAAATTHVCGPIIPPPSGAPGNGSEQADTLKQPTAVQSNDLSNFMFCIENSWQPRSDFSG